MASKFSLERRTYRHIILEGTAYAAGQMLGRLHKQDPRFSLFCSAADFSPAQFGFTDLRSLQTALERLCPGLNEEIAGFCDACEVPPEKAFHYLASSAAVAGCSHMVIHPSITQDGHVYVGRSYELNPADEDLCLVTSHIQGKARHIGFSTLFIGRLDGINEYGVIITMSAGITPTEREKRRGFDFWVYTRAVLDRCRSVSEALDLLKETALNCYTIFLIADPSGEAALVEIAGSRRAIRRLSHTEPYLIANNHYSLPEMQADNLGRDLSFSTSRREAVQKWLDVNQPMLTPKVLKAILSIEYPNGCFCPYYNKGFGTLWSMVFDAGVTNVQLTFGAPTHNPWRTFGLDGEVGVTDYQAVLPSKIEKS